MKRYFFEMAYDGSNYSGWQRQKNVPSIQQTIEDELGIILQRTARIHGCGRTDAGVHASQYYFHLDLESDPSVVLWKLNRMLPRDLALYRYFEVISKANAQKDAVSRSYQYLISTKKDPFRSKFSTIEFETLDLKLMKEALQIILGTHSFKNFCKRPEILPNTTCNIIKAELKFVKEQEMIQILVEGNRFLHHMMRLLVGNLIKVGKMRLSLQEFADYIDTVTTPKYFELAPAQGLTLKEIKYKANLQVSSNVILSDQYHP